MSERASCAVNRGREDSREFHTPGRIQVTRRASSPVQKPESRSSKDDRVRREHASGPLRVTLCARIDRPSPRRRDSGTETRVGTAIHTAASNSPLCGNLSVATYEASSFLRGINARQTASEARREMIARRHVGPAPCPSTVRAAVRRKRTSGPSKRAYSRSLDSPLS